MDYVLLGLLAVAFVIGLPVLVIVLLVQVSGLRGRLTDLEAAVKKMQFAAKAPVAAPDAASPADAQATQDLADNEMAAPVLPQPPPIPVSGASPNSQSKNAGKSGPWPVAASADPVAHMAPPAGPAGPSLLDRFGTWISTNWFYAVSAVSLALAGLFMVQYGIENGLIPPTLRVMVALAFGAGLIGAGEYIRRRFGDDVQSSTHYLPSVFSGAGIVTLFGGVLSARLLYGLIGPEVALVGMVAVAMGALVLGWLHGPLLAAVGIVGAFVAPMIVGGSSEDPSWVFVYFAVIAALGLGIDTLRRWAWVSGLSLGLGFILGWMLHLGSFQTSGAFALYVFALAMFAVLIPSRSLMPDHQGSPVTFALLGADRPIFPTLLSAAGIIAASASLAVLGMGGESEFWLSIIILTVLGVAWIFWSDTAPALQDQALAPLVALVSIIWLQGATFGPVAMPYLELPQPDLPPPSTPLAVSILVALGGVWTLAAAWRSWRGGGLRHIWAGAAALIAPVVAIGIDLTWGPSLVLGNYYWALHAAVIAALMVFLAERFSRLDGPNDRMRVALFTLSALSAITFALVIMLSASALTVAIAVAVLAAVWLDQKFDLAPLSVFVGLGVLALGYRLLADPGLDWATRAPFFDMVLAYGGTFAAVVAALVLARSRARITQTMVLESAAWSFGAIVMSLLVFRAIEAAVGRDGTNSHWGLGIYAAIWFAAGLAQLNLSSVPGKLRLLRYGLAAAFGALGTAAVLGAVILHSPLVSFRGNLVSGPMLFNTLIPAYLLPALVLAAGYRWIKGLPLWLGRAMALSALGLGVLWVFAAIRHFWQGAAGMSLARGFGQGEVSTYTVAVLLVGAVLFYQSLAAGDRTLRRAGLAVIGIAVAKVFLIDIASLGGLVRVFSFLLLGLALAGLAWLNAWAQKNEKHADGAEPPAP